MIQLKVTAIALLGIAIGAVAVRDKPEPVLKGENGMVVWETELPAEKKEPVAAGNVLPQAVLELPVEAWYGTARELTEYEWKIMAQTIMAEARGESHEVQYYIACVILNRVESSFFPNTVAGVIFQTNPVQFCGAWDTEEYEPTDSVLEAIQEALIHNDLPEDVYYFTSKGYLPGTEPWKPVGNMWFSKQS